MLGSECALSLVGVQTSDGMYVMVAHLVVEVVEVVFACSSAVRLIVVVAVLVAFRFGVFIGVVGVVGVVVASFFVGSALGVICVLCRSSGCGGGWLWCGV